ncbi:MAG: tRNA (adenosine(37)-N6)-threonylcarbamoyltransferase complex dimerization subunit type 1 TsaB, partial [Alphaproteobacteria bacterium]
MTYRHAGTVMKLLALDTTLGACSAAVLCAAGDRQRLFARFEERARGHAEALMPMVADVLAEAGVGYDELDRIALTRGPGTFTGVRIGVAAARGLALATGAALFATDSLSVIAADARERWQQENDGGARPQQIATLVDARRGEVY